MIITHKEPLSSRKLSKLPPSLNLNTTKYKEAILFRLLTGSSNIEYDYFGTVTTIKQRLPLFNSSNKKNKNISKKIFKKYLKGSSLNTADLGTYFENVKNTNYQLFDELLYEYSHYFINSQKGSHVNAFINTYRILEYISYSFPLVHASTSKNYQGTYTSLQSYFTKDGGELQFLKTFVGKMFDGDPILSSTVDIDIDTPNLESKKKIYKFYKRLLSQYSPICDDGLYRISIKYVDVIDIVKFIRNRYFHFAIGGQENIKTSDIIYPDLFFKQINRHAINWFSIIYFEILKYLVERWK